jgi:hypothetical protein
MMIKLKEINLDYIIWNEYQMKNDIVTIDTGEATGAI